jgi:type IV pilus assembly protein PilB
VGCEYCTNGYKGREGLYELLPVTTEISRLILKGVSALELLNTAHGLGMKTLRDSGLIKVRQGLTSLDEINRVTKD